MPEMDLQTFYHQAKAWKADEDEKARQLELEQRQKLVDAWKGATAAIREALPIEGIKIYENYPGMTALFPTSGNNYAFNVVLPGGSLSADEHVGVIQVIVNYDTLHHFDAYRFLAHSHYCDDVYEAFLEVATEVGLVENSL